MANVQGTFYRGETQRSGVTPSSPSNAADNPVNPVNPPGSGNTTLYKLLGDTTDKSFIGKNGYVPVVVGENVLTLQPFPNTQADGLISGGIVQWSGTGYIFNVSAALARFKGVYPLNSDPAILTLTTPDATNDRIDLFILQILFDGNGVPNGMDADFITGTPAASPVKPQINPATQIELTSVLVTASSTEPTLTEEVIYDENTEWTGTTSGTGTGVFNSAVDPYQGTVSVETTNIQNGFYVQFNNGAEIDISTYQTFGFQINLKASLGANQNLYVTFLDGSLNAVSNFVLINLDKSLTGYQFIGIALNSVNFTSFDVQYIRFSFVRTSGPATFSGYFLDIVKLEGGIAPPVTNNTFLNLTDTPSSYIGQAGKTVAVKADETGLEFVTGGGGGITGSGTINEIAYFTGATSIGSLTTATYPSLTELSYVKGVTSSIQTQLNTLGSKWTNGTGFIYRNGPVVIGDTVWSNDTSLTVKGNSATGSWVLKVEDSSGSDLIALLNDRRLFLYSDVINIGNSPAGATGVTIKSFSLIATLLQLQDSAGSIIFNINSNGEAYFRDDRISFGLPSGAPSTGITIKVPGTGFTNAHTIQDSTNAIKLRLFANGSVYSEATRHSFGPISGSIADGAHFKGASTGTNPQFAVDNSAATRLLSILGNGDISFSEGRGFIFGTTTGWKLGTATTQKLAFWNKTPIIQPTTAITGATLVGGGGTTITDTDTFGGYTLQQIAAALINTGILA